MYIIKHIAEDFYVKELFDPFLSDNGSYAYFILKKKNYTTIDALQKIADTLRIPFKHLGFAGSKDKKAVTEQVCSAYNVSKEALERIHMRNIELTFIGRGEKPTSLGDHRGNHFKIVVRNITHILPIKTLFINYFGTQRLSTNNATIGKLIIQRKFKEALTYFTDNTKVQQYLQDHSTDYLGALKKIPLKILKLYIHAYQSLLWNHMAEHSSAKTLPIIGFATEETPVIKEILHSEGITMRDFVIKQFPELSSEGGERALQSEAQDLNIWTLEHDEFHNGKKKITLEFTLDKGCYATEFIRQSFLE